MTRFSRFFAIFTLVVSTGVLLTASFDAEARRMGGGKSFGRQSTNVTQQRQAVTPPTAASSTTTQRAAATGTAAAAGAGAAAKSGMSRWLGPIAGIAAGLGIASLLSHLGLSGAFLELISSMVLIGVLVFGVLYLVRRLRGGAARPAMQQAGAGNGAGRQTDSQQPMWRQAEPAAPVAAAVSAAPEMAGAVPAAPVNEAWHIPADFDTAAFLAQAKKQFAAIQAIWDSGAVDELTQFLTDDLISELKPQMVGRSDGEQTQIVLLNAELLGIEKVQDGYLASVRYSGMLREAPNTEAFRFEEVWNLFKADGHGWLLAGIQQIPLEYAS